MNYRKILALTLVCTIVTLTACMDTEPDMDMDTDTDMDTDNMGMGMEDGAMPSTDGIEQDVTGTSFDEVYVGLGVVSSLDQSVGATADAEGNLRSLTTVCAVAVDEDDTIISVKFDTVEGVAGFSSGGELTTDINSAINSKKEMGVDYGMSAVSEIGKEWSDQMTSLEGWMMGKTVTDILGMSITDDNIPDVEELKTSVTIGVTDQLLALEKAYANAGRATV